jgi:RNA polymerase sigma-70 factor (ECF subfamily)
VVSDNSTSLSLLQRVRHRNQDAWDRLFKLYAPLVDHWCRTWDVYGPDADDIRQEVFQAVASNLETFRRDRPGDTFRGWLRVITRRKFLDYCRRRQRQPVADGGSAAQLRLLNVPELEDAPAEDSPDAVKQLHHRALALIRDQFEDRTWQAFWRTSVDGHSPLDVGRDMGMTPAAVRKAKSRVLRRLKEELGDLLG